MPYIAESLRKEWEPCLAPLLAKMVETADLPAGTINYLLTRILNHWYFAPNYSECNDMIGVLECAKLELYRRRVAEYEDQKCKENGDVY